MKKVQPLQLLSLLVLALVAISIGLSCSKKSGPNGPSGPDDPGPNPDGILLSGNATDSAFSAITLLPPSSAKSEDIVNGVMLTRLEAILNPAKTVGEVNATLESDSCRIVCMSPGSMLMSLIIPRQADSAAAAALADKLRSSGAFIDLFVSHVAEAIDDGVALSGTASPAILPGGAANDHIDHFEAMYFFPAWNVKAGMSNSFKPVVLVPDVYYRLTPHPEITAQTFATGSGQGDEDLVGSKHVGNHGFHVCGIIGANFDGLGGTGAFPNAQTHLSIKSIHELNLNWTEVVSLVSRAVEVQALSPGTFVLNTSLGYNDPTFASRSRYERTLFALDWRTRVKRFENRFLHAAAAGNDGEASGDAGDAAFNSPWNSASRFVDLYAILGSTTLTPFQELSLSVMRDNAEAAGAKDQPLRNVVIVGMSTAGGIEDSRSAHSPDIHAVGVGVYSLCVQPDPGHTPENGLCDGSYATNDGTSMATPAVAGLASYMLALNPNLSVEQLTTVIWSSEINKLFNAYYCVQAVDQGLSNANMRKSLLDVANSTGQESPDGKFDEHDLEMFTTKFQFFETERANAGVLAFDHSRYDLNGDGFTGGDGADFRSFFNLDADFPPVIEQSVSQNLDGVSRDFDENHLTDHEILCYYAWSSLYTGSSSERAAILSECVAPFVFNATMPQFVAKGGGATLTVTVTRTLENGTQPQQGVDITGEVSGGTPLNFTGITGADGKSSTVVTLGNNSDSMIVHVSASYEGRPVGDRTLVVHALAGPSAKLVIVKRISWTAAFAGGNTGGEWHEAFDTSLVAGPSSTVRDNQHSGTNTTGSVEASCTCSRTDSVSVLPDSTRLTIGYSFSNSVTATAISTEDGALWHASGTGIIQQEYLFTVRTSPANFTAAVSNLLEGSDNSLYFRFSLFPAGGNIPILDLEIPGGTTPPPPDTLNTVLPVGNYSVKIIYNSGAAANADNNSVTATTNCLSKGFIEIGAPSGTSTQALGYSKRL